MPVPIIVPIAAVAAAGTIGFLIGREMASASEYDDDAIFAPDLEDGPTDHGEEDASATTGMSEAEALEILELAPGATPDDIREAHRRLIQHLHPDQGGSGYLAGLVNRAKDVLLA